MTEGRLRTGWLLAVLAFFGMGAAWAFALPVNGSYDEKQHIVRAYAVSSGNWRPDGTALDSLGDRYEAFTAPRSLLPNDVDCTWRKPYRTADCMSWPDSREKVLLPSAAARYSPVYYLLVGVPLVFSPDHTGIILARLVSVLLSTLLLASAGLIALRLGNRLLMAGVALVATPLAMSLNGSVNGNGLEIAAGVLLYCALLALLRGPAPGEPGGEWAPTRRLLLLAGAAAALLLTVRHMGPLLVVLVGAACLLVAAPGRIRLLLRRRDTRWILGGFLAAGVAFALAWIASSRVVDLPPDVDRAKHLSTGDLLHQIASVRVPFYVKQIVGQFGYGETTISTLAIAAWYGLIAVVVVPALLTGGWRVRVAIAGLLTVCLAVLVGLELRFVPLVGWYSHGRYVLAAAVGAVLIAAFAWRWRVRGGLVLVLVLATVPLHLYALVRVMTRYQVGIDAGLDPFAGNWRPVGGPVTPLLVLMLGLVALLVLTGLSVRGGAREGSTAPPESH